MFLLLVYLFIALFISFLCSIMEAVLLSTPQSYLMVKQEEGRSWATKFLDYKINIDKPLSAILSLNTVAHTVGAAGVGAQAVKVFGEAYFGIVSAILTILILIVTEIIPKTIGAMYSRRLAHFAARVIQGMIVITWPLVLMSAFLTRVISPKEKENTTSREELVALANIGADEGVFTNREEKIIQNLLRLKDLRVSAIMTPRVVVASADENMSLKDFLLDKKYLRFSRIPIYSKKEEHITGYVFRPTALEKHVEEQHNLSLKDIKREIVVVPNSIVLFTLWERLLDKKEHLALVVDEYGGMDGVVTMEDLIETLLGLEILDERDAIADMQQYARDRWKQRQAKYKLIDGLNDPGSDLETPEGI
jgi:CBS domain containing-hemolysin-like protein